MKVNVDLNVFVGAVVLIFTQVAPIMGGMFWVRGEANELRKEQQVLQRHLTQQQHEVEMQVVRAINRLDRQMDDFHSKLLEHDRLLKGIE